MELVGLLSQCCTGKNAQGEMLVRELLPLSDLVQQCLLPELTPALRANYMLLLDEAYLDTDKHQKEVATSEDVRQLLLVLRQRVASFVEDLQDPEKCNFAEEDEESEEMLQQAEFVYGSVMKTFASFYKNHYTRSDAEEHVEAEEFGTEARTAGGQGVLGVVPREPGCLTEIQFRLLK